MIYQQGIRTAGTSGPEPATSARHTGSTSSSTAWRPPRLLCVRDPSGRLLDRSHESVPTAITPRAIMEVAEQRRGVQWFLSKSISKTTPEKLQTSTHES